MTRCCRQKNSSRNLRRTTSRMRTIVRKGNDLGNSSMIPSGKAISSRSTKWGTRSLPLMKMRTQVLRTTQRLCMQGSARSRAPLLIQFLRRKTWSLAINNLIICRGSRMVSIIKGPQETPHSLSKNIWILISWVQLWTPLILLRDHLKDALLLQRVVGLLR